MSGAVKVAEATVKAGKVVFALGMACLVGFVILMIVSVAIAVS